MCEKRTKLDISLDAKFEEFLDYDYSQIEIKSYDCSQLQYDYFFKEHMLRNLPCIIKNITQTWKCSKLWVENDTINYDYFIKQYGQMEAPVADCNQINFNAQCKCDMKVKNYMSYLRSKSSEKLLYLKDWHLRRLTLDNYFYEVPEVFASDWLNEYAIDTKDDDFMFVYIGPKNTWTPFHVDVYTSYSWSVNVTGRKKWILLPPGEEEKLKDTLGNLPLLFDPEKFHNIDYFEIIQEKGDGLFVPSGWHHQVFNDLDTISINHNFVNACNIEIVWKALQKNLISVEHEIKEFREMPEFTSQCQLILKSVFGMDFESFVNFIIHIAQKRLDHMNGVTSLLFNVYCLEKNHICFDLKIILKIIQSIQNHHLFLKNIISPNIALELLNIEQTINESLN
nr:jmjC domain-containing protein 4 homolog [Vanessa tameamea]